ncbi:MAG: RNA polymerase sigma-70 factor [Dysgonomonas sp.]|nr:RNA polymerase sigma-70 factor [Dysgonomonas sp.]
MLNDIFVIKKIKEGDIKVFEDVFRQYYSSLCFYSFSITGRKDVAEEILQDLFYIIWKEKENLQITYSLKSYLYRAVRNRSLQFCEQRNVQDRYKEEVMLNNEKPDTSPQEQLEYKELEEVINKALIKLPERRRKIFKMHRMEGLKYKEIAEKLSLSVKTIEAEMTKTYQILRKEVDRYTHLL